MKTNAARILEQLGIDFSLREYLVDENDLSAVSVAGKIGLPPDQVFKTLVVRGDRTGILLAIVPGDSELDLKRLASVSGNKSVALVPLKEVQPLTGYIRGGVSPLGTRKRFPAFLDDSAEVWDELAVSAGIRGTQLLLAPADLIRATGAVVADLV